MSDSRAASPNIKGFAAPSYRISGHFDSGGHTFMERFSVSRLRYAARHSRQKQFERFDARFRRQWARVIVPISATAAVAAETAAVIRAARTIAGW